MSTSTFKQLPKATVELEIHIPWPEIADTHKKIFEAVVAAFELPGFRKGKVSPKLVEEKIDKTKIYQEVVKEIIPKAYQQAISEHKLAPVAAPKVEVVRARQKEEWVVKATIALRPKINLKNYKDKIRQFKKSAPKIWTPGQKEEGKKENLPAGQASKPPLDELLKILLEEVEIELSDLLISEEANRLLANLVDQTQKLGLTVEQYLVAKGKTSEQIRAEYAKEAARNLKLEFALVEIADSENITVAEKDLENILAKVEKEEQREKLRKDSYYLAHLIRQQKTLDFLSNL